MAEGIEVFRCQFKKGSDVNQYLTGKLSSKSDPAIFMPELLRSAHWLGKSSRNPEHKIPLEPKKEELAQSLDSAPATKVQTVPSSNSSFTGADPLLNSLAALSSPTPLDASATKVADSLAFSSESVLKSSAQNGFKGGLDPVLVCKGKKSESDLGVAASGSYSSGLPDTGIAAPSDGVAVLEKQMDSTLKQDFAPSNNSFPLAASLSDFVSLLNPASISDPDLKTQAHLRPDDQAVALGIKSHSKALPTDESSSVAAPTGATVGDTNRISSFTPSTPSPILPHRIEAETVFISLGQAEYSREWRVKGLFRNQSPECMRVNLMIRSLFSGGFHVDTFDLYHARNRATFLNQALVETAISEEILRIDCGKVLLLCEDLLLKKQSGELGDLNQNGFLGKSGNSGQSYSSSPGSLEHDENSAENLMSETEKKEALSFLCSPSLVAELQRDYDFLGVAGERSGRLLGYLAATSRKLEDPLAVIIQSSSAAGKTSLMEAVLAFMPKEEKIKYAAMTGQSLFYMGEMNLKHKILAIVEEEGAEKAAYALKLLQSEGELRIASTGKDSQSGRMITQEYFVEGPVMIFMTTTSLEIDEEFVNRCLVISVDESREQTLAIHELQRESQTLEGLLRRQNRDQIRKKHQNAQRLLKPFLVVNPYAKELSFLADRTRSRRDHMKYLTLIRSIAFLFQYQRPIKSMRVSKEFEEESSLVEYIEVTLEDIQLANELMQEVMGKSCPLWNPA